jgi:hypothetical protein
MLHSENIFGARVSYWCRENGQLVACDKAEADAVEVGNGYPSFNFDLPSQDHEFRKLCAALEAASAFGRTSAQMEIRRSLGL